MRLARVLLGLLIVSLLACVAAHGSEVITGTLLFAPRTQTLSSSTPITGSLR